MPSREEINEWLDERLKRSGAREWSNVRCDILNYLHSQGVVIKKHYAGMTHRNTWQEVFIVEPLIREETNDR